MSEQYPGGWLTKSPPTVTTSSAPGLWTLSQQAQYQKAGTWPSPPVGWMGAFTTGDTCSNYDVQIDSSGNIYASGWDSTASAIIVSKISNTGALQWVKTYTIDTPAITDPAGIVGTFQNMSYLDSSNNLFFGFPTGYAGGGIIKINSSGVVQNNTYVDPGFLHVWTGTKGASNTPYLSTTRLTTGYQWTGLRFDSTLSSTTSSWSIQGGSGNPGVFTIGIDSSGNMWGSGQQANGAGASLIAKGATSFYYRYYQTAGAVGNQGGGCVMVGDSSGNMYHTPNLGDPYYIIKWTSSGTVSWARQVTGGYAQTYGGTMDSSGNLNLLYYASGYNGGQFLRVDSSGSIVLQQRFTTATNCTLYAIKTDPNDGSLVIVGSFGSTPRAMILRIPSTGASGASWTIGGATLSCATSTVFSLSSASFSTETLSQTTSTPPTPSTRTVTTSTPTPTWSKYG